MKIRLNKNKRWFVINNNSLKRKLDLGDGGYVQMNNESSIGERSMKNRITIRTDERRSDMKNTITTFNINNHDRREDMNNIGEIKKTNQKNKNSNLREESTMRKVLYLMLSIVLLFGVFIATYSVSEPVISGMCSDEVLRSPVVPVGMLGVCLGKSFGEWISSKLILIMDSWKIWGSMDLTEEWNLAVVELRSIYSGLKDIVSMLLERGVDVDWRSVVDNVVSAEFTLPLVNSLYMKMNPVYLLLLSNVVFWMIVSIQLNSYKRKLSYMVQYNGNLSRHYVPGKTNITKNKGGITMSNYEFNNGNAGFNAGNTGMNVGTQTEGGSGMKTGVENETVKSGNRMIAKGFIYIVLGIGIILFGIFLISNNSDFVKEPIKKYVPEKMEKKVNREEVVKAIYHNLVIPEISKCQAKNEELLNRCIQSFDEQFKPCYAGIDEFLDDLTSWGTKFGIGWNYLKGDSEKYIREKFEKYIISEDKLAKIVENVTQQYIEAVKANTNVMYLNIKVNLGEISQEFDIPQEMTETIFTVHFSNMMDRVNYGQTKVLQNAIMSYLFSEIGSMIAVKGVSILATQIPIRTVVSTVSRGVLAPAMAMIGSNLAVTTAGAGAGAATTAGAGATIGSIVPGFGTIVGFVIGAVVGYFIEAHNDKKFKEDMKPQLETTVDNIRENIKMVFVDYMSKNTSEFMSYIANEFRILTYQYVFTNEDKIINGWNTYQAKGASI